MLPVKGNRRAGYNENTKRQIIARLQEMNTETSKRMADEMAAALK
jgi:hypothetical protein